MRFTLTYFGGFAAGQFDAPIQHLEPFGAEEDAIRHAAELMREGRWHLLTLLMDGRVLLNPQQLRVRCGSPTTDSATAEAAMRPRVASVRPVIRKRAAGSDIYEERLIAS